MEVLSFIVLILLSLVGYSAGAASRAGKGVDFKPVLIDLFLVLLIWAGAVYSRLAYDFNKWFLILVWILIGAVIGMAAVSLRRVAGSKEKEKEVIEEQPLSLWKRIWKRWKGFSLRMGSFQSRVLLSLFFFLFITPAALLVKGLGDPLRIKTAGSKGSFWLAKGPASAELEDFRRQF